MINTGYMAALFDNKLSTKRVIGLTQDYILLDSTPISDKALEDIATYEEFKIEVGEYLKEKIGKDSISKDYFEKTIQDYVFSNLPNNFENKYRRSELTSCLIVTYTGEFNIVPTTELVGRKYNKETIKKALEKIEMK